MHGSEAELPPVGVKETVWYQIFPERFANGGWQSEPANVLPWGAGLVHLKSFYGGELAGIAEDVEVLAGLGVNGLYLWPIFT